MASTLKDMRAERNRTLDKVAYESGITFSLLSRYENGLVMPGLKNLSKLATYYGVSADVIIAAIEAAREQGREVVS